jgi:hypothetical protein
MTMPRAGSRLTVKVDSAVNPLLLAPAIRTKLAGGHWPTSAEAQVGQAVADAVARARESGSVSR